MAVQQVQASLEPYFLPPGSGQHLQNLGLRFVATDALTGGKLFAAECVNPGPGGPPLHTHHVHDEAYFVLSGAYRFRVDGVDRDGGPGTFVFVPRGTSHTFASVGPEEGRILAFSFPGLEQFLERMSEIASRGGDRREMEELFSDFQSDIDGPGLV